MVEALLLSFFDGCISEQQPSLTRLGCVILDSLVKRHRVHDTFWGTVQSSCDVLDRVCVRVSGEIAVNSTVSRRKPTEAKPRVH